MKRVVPLVAILCLPAPLALAEASVFGEWCADGWGIVIEAASMGNFEHTVCAFDDVQPEGRSLETEMTCRGYYINEDAEPEVINESRARITAQLLEDDVLQVDYSDDRGVFEFARCEGE